MPGRCCHESQTPIPPTVKAQRVLVSEYQLYYIRNEMSCTTFYK